MATYLLLQGRKIELSPFSKRQNKQPFRFFLQIIIYYGKCYAEKQLIQFVKCPQTWSDNINEPMSTANIFDTLMLTSTRIKHWFICGGLNKLSLTAHQNVKLNREWISRSLLLFVLNWAFPIPGGHKHYRSHKSLIDRQ